MSKKQNPDQVVRTVVKAFMLNYMVRKVVDNLGQLNGVDPSVKTQTIFNEVNKATKS